VTNQFEKDLADLRKVYGKHGITVMGENPSRWLKIRKRALPADYQPSHADQYPKRDYNVVRVSDTWFRTAPNFREIISSENPVAQAFAT
jgi:hypothetical protein